MRQFGSSLNHNGMSLFIATVPEGTELYHGTSTKDRVNGTQWLAFEPEHALIFARGRRGPPPGHPPGDGHAPPPEEEDAKTRRRNTIFLMADQNTVEAKMVKVAQARLTATKDVTALLVMTLVLTVRIIVHRHHRTMVHQQAIMMTHLAAALLAKATFLAPGLQARIIADLLAEVLPLSIMNPHLSGSNTMMSIMMRIRMIMSTTHTEHREFSLPPIGYWVHRLGDLLRNPKRRHVPPPTDLASESVQSEVIETRAEQEPLTSGKPEDQDSGYLHTYRTRHSLRLLYVDGQSAAKSKKGTLDTQDVLLLEDSIDHDSGMFGERERAAQLCKLAHEKWNDRVDGILRMEGGFEIILCDFAAHLDVVSIAKTNPEARGGFGGGSDNGDGFNYYRAVAARYHGIGGGRAVLDYEEFVSAFAYPEAISFDDTGRPRLNNRSAAIDDMRRAVDKMILQKSDSIETVDWQAIADMVVARYADRIEYLASGSLKSLAALQSEIERALRPFIDYNARNSSSEIERCASQFMPNSTNVAAQAIRQVTNTLCSSLVTASEQTDYTIALEQIKQLKEYLAWTTWKQCRGCAADEICFLPIWPVGTAEDFEQPRCRSDVSLGPGQGGGDRYWNDFGGPGRKGPGPQKRRKKSV
ncbi:hypothetical protein KCU99_g301, partial [Aureobasidium melanogenum]